MDLVHPSILQPSKRTKLRTENRAADRMPTNDRGGMSMAAAAASAYLHSRDRQTDGRTGWSVGQQAKWTTTLRLPPTTFKL
jgi:hypothetical protein